MADHATSQDFAAIDSHITNIGRLDADLARNLQIFVENLDMEGNLTHQRAALVIRSLGQVHDWLRQGHATCQVCPWEGLESELDVIEGEASVSGYFEPNHVCPSCHSDNVCIFHQPSA